MVIKPDFCDFHTPETQRQNFVYEVFRVVKKHPLFIEDHLERLQFSLSKKFNERFAPSFFYEIKTRIFQFIKTQNQTNFNIRLEFFSPISCALFVVPQQYPTSQQYLTGVKTVSADISRHSPQLKIWKEDYKQKIAQLIEQHKVFEVLLFTDNLLTEGSKSTIFWIKDNTLFTTPDQLVLNGITRKKVIEIAGDERIKFRKQQIDYQELISSDAVFICGTSPKILPVCQIDSHIVAVDHALLRKMMQLFDLSILAYLNKNESKPND